MEDQLKGKFNEVKGDVTGDGSEELKGKGQQKIGDVKEGIGDVTDKAEDKQQQQEG